MRRRLFSLAALMSFVVVMLVLAGCGTHGRAGALGKTASASLAAPGASHPAGTASLAPFDAIHVAPFYRGAAIPVTGAQYPAQLRQGSCVGSFIASLSDGNVITPANNGGATTPPALTQPDPRGGVDVAVAPSANLYVVVIDHPNDPNAPVVACGHPLSGLRQYFDLYPPQTGSNGIGRGTALMESLAATRVTVTLTSVAAASTTWAVRSGSCDGTTLASGTIAAGASQGSGVIFQPVQAGAWWVSVTSGGGLALCGDTAA